MRTKLLMLFFLMQLPLLVVAENEVKIQKCNWTCEDDRSFTYPYLSMDDESIYIYSEKQLDDVYVVMTNSNGRVLTCHLNYYNAIEKLKSLDNRL